MIPRNPLENSATHIVTNMPPYLGDQDLWLDVRILHEAVTREKASWAEPRLAQLGRIAGADATCEKAELANRFVPEIKTFDRYVMRVNQVSYHPAYHELMALAVENEVASFAWNHAGQGAQVGHAALSYMFRQVEGAVICPMAMTYSAIPALQALLHAVGSIVDFAEHHRTALVALDVNPLILRDNHEVIAVDALLRTG